MNGWTKLSFPFINEVNKRCLKQAAAADSSSKQSTAAVLLRGK